jgi:hypothetical protein
MSIAFHQAPNRCTEKQSVKEIREKKNRSEVQGIKPEKKKQPRYSTVPKQCRRVSFPPLDPENDIHPAPVKKTP